MTPKKPPAQTPARPPPEALARIQPVRVTPLGLDAAKGRAVPPTYAPPSQSSPDAAANLARELIRELEPSLPDDFPGLPPPSRLSVEGLFDDLEGRASGLDLRAAGLAPAAPAGAIYDGPEFDIDVSAGRLGEDEPLTPVALRTPARAEPSPPVAPPAPVAPPGIAPTPPSLEIDFQDETFDIGPFETESVATVANRDRADRAEPPPARPAAHRGDLADTLPPGPIAEHTIPLGSFLRQQATVPHRKPLGELLVEDGLLSQSQLDLALARQRRTRERLGEAIVALGFATAEAIARAVGEQSHVAFAEIVRAPLAPALRDLLGESFCREHRVLPLRLLPGTLHLALVSPSDGPTIEAVRAQTGLAVVPSIATSATCSRCWI